MNSEVTVRTTFDYPIDVIWRRLKRSQENHFGFVDSDYSVFKNGIVDSNEEYFSSAGHFATECRYIDNARFEITVLPWSHNRSRMATRIHLNYRWGIFGKLLGLLFVEPQLRRQVATLHAQSFSELPRCSEDNTWPDPVS